MPKVAQFLAATTLAFGSVFFAIPSQADWIGTNANIANGAVQFDYRGGSASQTITVPENATNATLSLSVNNTIANRIGGGELADTWSVTINGNVYTNTEITSSTISVPVSGQVTITVSGIDRGFWAGWYGPIISSPVLTYDLPVLTPIVIPEPVIPAPTLTPTPT